MPAHFAYVVDWGAPTSSCKVGPESGAILLLYFFLIISYVLRRQRHLKGVLRFFWTSLYFSNLSCTVRVYSSGRKRRSDAKRGSRFFLQAAKRLINQIQAETREERSCEEGSKIRAAGDSPYGGQRGREKTLVEKAAKASGDGSIDGERSRCIFPYLPLLSSSRSAIGKRRNKLPPAGDASTAAIRTVTPFPPFPFFRSFFASWSWWTTLPLLYVYQTQ